MCYPYSLRLIHIDHETSGAANFFHKRVSYLCPMVDTISPGTKMFMEPWTVTLYGKTYYLIHVYPLALSLLRDMICLVITTWVHIHDMSSDYYMSAYYVCYSICWICIWSFGLAQHWTFFCFYFTSNRNTTTRCYVCLRPDLSERLPGKPNG